MDVSDERLKTKEEAAAWLLHLESGNATRADREALVEWLRESPLHVAEMLRQTNVHDALASFDGWADIDAGDSSAETLVVPLSDRTPGEPQRAPPAARRGWPRWPVLAASAVCLAAIAIGGVALWARSGDVVITTERGEQRTLTLSDGSVLQIDPTTQLRIHFEKSLREVRLNRGRAVFKVASNPLRPFVVKAEATIVRAVGTSFGVERSRSGVRVTVSEGKVVVSSGPSAPSLPLPEISADGRPEARQQKAPAEVFLTANQQVTVPPAGGAEVVRAVDSDRELAWARGQLVFEKTTVATIVESFNRYNQMQLRVTDVALSRVVVSGVFDASDPESFVAFLRTTANIRVTRSGDEAVELASAH